MILNFGLLKNKKKAVFVGRFNLKTFILKLSEQIKDVFVFILYGFF